jgi:tRNA-modifying protein YgfZ
MPCALLKDRGVVKVSGEEARAFLDGLITIAMGTVGRDRGARYGALLTPQGKIVVDFIIAEVAEAESPWGSGFCLDCPRPLAADLARRLAMYKLRAKIAIEDLSDKVDVSAVWGADDPKDPHAIAYADPRLAGLGRRLISPRAPGAAAVADEAGPAAASASAATLASEAFAYDAHRIALGVPQGGRDFVYGETFPHEANLDQLGGVDFDKGCYVGQEVVSRMEHRGSARTRIVPVVYPQGVTPMEGAEVSAGERRIGRAGSGLPGGRGLAMLRLDRLEEAIAAGQAVTADGIALQALRPAFARFAVPGAPA